MTTVLEQDTITVEKFSVEAAKKNADLVMTTIPGNPRLRGPMDPMRTIKTKDKYGKEVEVVPRDQAINLATFPKTPGMQLHIDPEKGVWVITDPMRGDEELCERVRDWMQENSPYGVGDKLDGVERITGTMDADQMKTMLREVRNMLDEGDFTPCRGTTPPHRSEIDEMPGDYLWNAGNLSTWNGPKYEKDFADYKRSVEAHGG